MALCKGVPRSICRLAQSQDAAVAGTVDYGGYMCANQVLRPGLSCVLLTAALSTYANEAHQALSGMSEPRQKGALAALLSDAGERCPSATRVFYRGADKNKNAYWSVTCSTGQSFQIQIKPDVGGSTKIVDCAVLRTVAKIDCFRAF